MGFEVDRVQEIAARVAASTGLEVVEAELRGSGNKRMLRIFIDKAGGVTHEDCANYSREIGTIFDVEDVIPGGSYVLEVSSPGLDRRLSRGADFERFMGSRVKITTHDPVNQTRVFEGKLAGFQDGRLTVEVGAPRKQKKGKPKTVDAPPQRVDIELANVEKANLVPEI